MMVSVSSSVVNVSFACLIADVWSVAASGLLLFLSLFDTGLLCRFICCLKASSQVGDVVGDVGKMKGLS